jgi:tetratricopeptide (TPR) repeat protein
MVVGVLLFAHAQGCDPAGRTAADAHRAYEAGAYQAAAAKYTRALLRVPSRSFRDALLCYNIGTAQYKADEPRAAAAAQHRSVQTVTRRPTTQAVRLRFRAFHNLGNAWYRQQDFAAAADAYREALRLDPTALDTKHNLELALEHLAQQSLAEGPARDDLQSPAPEPGEGPEQPLPRRPTGLSEEDARRLLDMLGADDARRQRERLRRLLPPVSDVEKDW